MHVLGRKLRMAVGAGIAALMLTVGVSSVGATAPSSVGSIDHIIIVSVGGPLDFNPNHTNTTYRNPPTASNRTGGGAQDDCRYLEIGSTADGHTVASIDIDKCGAQTLTPITPLWEVVNGGSKSFVVPQTQRPRNGTVPAETYVIDTFR
ncbi:MAG: hypothetical protein LC793_00200 [Thermomicrobia bacterium]|nr:hypothetical protein [Thermomicrobia bacterium]